MKKSMGFYNSVTKLLSGVVKLLFRVDVTGLENENFDGAAVYCANHMSNWDAVILACVTKRPMTFVAKKELFDVPVLRSFLKALGVEPIDRGKSDLLALKTILGILKDGNSIFMFPQGTRHPGENPEGTEVKCGVSMMVKHTKATVLPIGIYTKDYKIKLFKKVYVNIGKPVTYEQLGIEDSSREEYERVAGVIFNDVCELCKKSEEKSNGTK